MRITPLAVWVHNLADEDLETVVRAEVSLTHPNKIVQEACVCYCICIKYLIKTAGIREKALKEMK